MYGQSLSNSAPASCFRWHGGSSPRMPRSPYCGGVAVFHLLTLSAIFPCSIVFPLTAGPESGYAGLEAFCKLAQSLQRAARLAARGMEMYGHGGDACPLYLRRNRHGAWKGGSPGIKNVPHRSAASACQKPRKSARGQRPFRTLIVPCGVYAGVRRFLRREILSSRVKIVSLQFPRPEIRRISAESGRGGRRRGICRILRFRQRRHWTQTENSRRGARRERYSPVLQPGKKGFLTNGRAAAMRRVLDRRESYCCPARRCF